MIKKIGVNFKKGSAFYSKSLSMYLYYFVLRIDRPNCIKAIKGKGCNGIPTFKVNIPHSLNRIVKHLLLLKVGCRKLLLGSVDLATLCTLFLFVL